MRNRYLYQTMFYMAIPVLIGLVLIGLASAANSVEQNDAMEFTRVDLSVEDLVSVYGLNIYKFNLQSSAAKEYRIILREKHAKDKPWKNLFSEAIRGSNEPNLILKVSFTRVDGQFGKVFFTGEKEADFSVKLCTEKYCFAGMSTIVPVPLLNLNRGGIVLRVHRSANDVAENNPDEIRLFTMKPSGRLARETGDSVYPRAELLLQKVK